MSEPSKVDRDTLHLLAKHSKWEATSIRKVLLNTGLRPGISEWMFFIDYLLLSLGAIFLVCGLFFFFAYNWNSMSKFLKLGFAQFPIVGLGIYLFFKKTNSLIGKIVLTALSCLIGLAFAVYGQIYQTGATAFDFLSAWALLSLVWVLISDFPPLWFLYLILLNLTVLFRIEQFHRMMDYRDVSVIFTLLNFVALLGFETLNHYRKPMTIHRWFPQVVGAFILWILFFNLAGYILNDFPDSQYRVTGPLILWLAFLLIPMGFVWFYHVKKEIIMTGLIPFSGICLIALLIGKMIEGNELMMFLIIGIFVVVSCGFLISFLTRFKKKISALNNVLLLTAQENES